MSRILVIDDNPDIVEATASLLAQWKHEVLVARDGISAVRLARAWRPQVVLLDIGLPGLDGFQVAAALRKEPALASCRIIAVSAIYREGDDQSLAAAGVDQILRKPLDPAFLRSLLGRSAGRAGEPPAPPRDRAEDLPAAQALGEEQHELLKKAIRFASGRKRKSSSSSK